MPAEAIRLQRRIGGRDRRFLAALAAAAAIGTPLVLLLQHHSSAAGSPAGATCIAADHAGVMGFGTYHYCGGQAVTFCKQFGPTEAAIEAKCVRLGLASGRPPQ